MRQAEFERRYAGDWLRIERWLTRQSMKPSAREAVRQRLGESADSMVATVDFPPLYRALCAQLSLARARRYSPALIERLHALVQQGHHALYGAQAGGRRGMVDFLLRGFPRRVRAERGWVALGALLFFGPLLAMGIAVQQFPELAGLVLAPHELGQYESMYDPARERLGQRPAASSAEMFGFYIWNNVRIGFQTFAGGVLFGLGSGFFLLFNGVVIGTVIGHLTQVGLGPQIFSFVAGHSALELIAIAISGAAGLKLGGALLAPGRRSRRSALVAEGRLALQLAGGAGLMFLAAAAVEAFWSPLVLPAAWPKYAVGALGWLLAIAYFVIGGRRAG